MCWCGFTRITAILPVKPLPALCKNNLWGLDIDDRAAQLAYFAVMMKALHSTTAAFSPRGAAARLCHPGKQLAFTATTCIIWGRGMSDIERNNAVNQMNTLLDEFIDAKEYWLHFAA